MKRNKKKHRNPWLHSRFLVADGTQVTPVSEPGDLSNSLVIYSITRDEIVTGDTARLIHDMSPTLDNPLFAAGPGRVIFSVDGHDGDPRDLLLSPEFGSFVRKVEQAGLCWLYYARPETLWPRAILMASSQERLYRETGNQSFQIGVDSETLHRFLSLQIRQYRSHCGEAGIRQRAADAHLNDTIEKSFPNCPPMGLAN